MITSVLNTNQSLSNKIFVDCSTVHPETIRSTAKQLHEREASFVSAPVFGGNPIAVAGKLVFAIGGPRQASEVVKGLIQDVMGRKVIDCGEEAAKSSLLKIAGFVLFFPFLLLSCFWGVGVWICLTVDSSWSRNIVTVSLMESVGESQVFAEKSGLGMEPMEELITEAFGPVAGGYSKRYVTHTHTHKPMNGNDLLTTTTIQTNIRSLRTTPRHPSGFRRLVVHQRLTTRVRHG